MLGRYTQILWAIATLKLGVAATAIMVGLKLDGAITPSWVMTLGFLWVPPITGFVLGFFQGLLSKRG
jgi:hypothetical protein